RMQRRKTRTRQEVASVWNNLRRLRFQHDRNDIETFGSQHDVPCSARSTSDSRDLTEDVASVALFRTRMAVGMKSAGQVVGPSCLTSGSRCDPGAPSGYYPKGYAMSVFGASAGRAWITTCLSDLAYRNAVVATGIEVGPVTLPRADVSVRNPYG